MKTNEYHHDRKQNAPHSNGKKRMNVIKYHVSNKAFNDRFIKAILTPEY